MSALARSPLADAMREAGLSEEQVSAALEAAAKVAAESPVQALKKRVDALGLEGVRAEICRESAVDGGDWLRIVLVDAGTICCWPPPSLGRRVASWHLDASTTNPDGAPSLMQRAQFLHDLYRKLVES